MSCYGCASKYSIFNKEHGCPHCGYSFCNKCLKYKAVVPKLGNTEHLVCKSCQTALTNVQTKSTQREHPAASLQRLASLESPPRPPITVYKHDQRIQQLKVGLTPTDIEIAERLEKLREDRKRGPLPSEDEIAERLALLKGEQPIRILPVQSKPMVALSEQQQVDDLLSQLQEEQQLALNQTTQAVDEITSRLEQLRGHDRSVQSSIEKGNAALMKLDGESNSIEAMELNKVDSLLASEFTDVLEKSAESCVKDARSMLRKGKTKEENDLAMTMSDDDDECEEDVIKQILAKAALEEELELSDNSGGTDSDIEKPCCVICDKNAQLKCIGCSGDLYCEACFKVGHKDFDMKDHKAVALEPSTKK